MTGDEKVLSFFYHILEHTVTIVVTNIPHMTENNRNQCLPGMVKIV